MKGLTAPELCRVVGMRFKRFETLRRRAREEFATADVVDADTFDFPVNDGGDGWSRHDFADVLRLAVTVELERQGLDFKSAARIATRITVLDQIRTPAAQGDFWIGRHYCRHPEGWEAHPFVDGSYSKVTEPCWPDAETLSVVLCNVSAIERSMRVALAASGYEIAGDAISKNGGR